MIMLHLANYKRKFSLFPIIESIGYISQKRNIVNNEFKTCNFSFILSGEGFYYKNGIKYHLKAPAVILQWPNEQMHYGPYLEKGGEWEELFIIYSVAEQDKLTQSKLFDVNTFYLRQFEVNTKFNHILDMLKDMMREKSDLNSKNIMEFDRLATELIMQSFEINKNEKMDDIILIIKNYLHKNLSQKIDLHYLSKKTNMSISSLVRYWKKHYSDLNFTEYRDQIFLQISCRKLIESNLDIKSIAFELGFDDQYYFSRKFHKLSGKTATNYRIQHKIFFS